MQLTRQGRGLTHYRTSAPPAVSAKTSACAVPKLFLSERGGGRYAISYISYLRITRLLSMMTIRVLCKYLRVYLGPAVDIVTAFLKDQVQSYLPGMIICYDSNSLVPQSRP